MKIRHLTTAAFAIVVSLTLSGVPAAAQAQTFTIESTMGELLGNPQAKAVLTYVPDMVSSPQIDMARSMTLHSLQAYAPDLTDEKLAQINTDLTAIK